MDGLRIEKHVDQIPFAITPDTIYLVKTVKGLELYVADKDGASVAALSEPDISGKADLDPITKQILESQLPKSILGGKTKTLTFANALYPHIAIAKWFPDKDYLITAISASISIASGKPVECQIRINGEVAPANPLRFPAGA